jgi:hypothetical protein
MKPIRATVCAAFAALLFAWPSAPTLGAVPTQRPEEPAPRPRFVNRAPAPQTFVETPVEGGAVWAVRGKERSVFVAAREARIVQKCETGRFTVAMEFVGSDEDAALEPTRIEKTRVNVLRGPRDAWKSGLRTASALETRDAWPGVDVRWETGHGSAKYAFVVAPGADASQVRLRWRGAESVRVDATGDLVVATPAGEIRDARPVAWTEDDGARKPVDVRWAVKSENVATFDVGEHDADATLVIDPAIVVSSGFIGGIGDEPYEVAVATDATGAAYVGGGTGFTSTDFPTTVGAFDTTPDRNDGYVAKVAPDGASFVWITLLGGASDENISGIAVDEQGRPLVCGTTYSNETSFPVLGGPDLVFNGVGDAFVARVKADGTGLDWCGYIGGSGVDLATAAGVDAAGALYVCGSTRNNEASFPVTVGPDLVYGGESYEGFVAKVATDGALAWCGFIGGNGRDYAFGMSVTPTGVAVVVGQTMSTDLPVVGNLDSSPNGDDDGFIAVVKADGTGFDQFGYFGGAQLDGLYDADVDADGNLYVCGFSYSKEATFPVLVGPDLTNAGQEDGVIAKFSPTGTLLYCGFIGGTENNEEATSVEVDALGRPIVVGYTRSGEQFHGFPVLGGPDLTHNGNEDAFAATVLADGSGFSSIGFIGGSGGDRAYSVAIAPTGAIWVVGRSDSTQATFPTLGGPDVTQNGDDDHFLTRLADAAESVVVTDSFFAPSAVTLYANAKTPARSRLLASGNLDVGTNTLDPQGETRVTIGSRAQDFPSLGLDAKGRSFRLKNNEIDLRVKFSVKGASQSSFQLTLVGDFVGAIDPDGTLDFRFENGGVDAAGKVKLADGRYRSAKPRGALTDPDLAVESVRGTSKGAGKDTLVLRARFATAGTTPAEASEVEVSFGGTFSQTIPAAGFTKRGDRFIYTSAGPGVTQLVLDYARETITLQAKKTDLGAWPEARNAAELRVSIGDDQRAVRVLVGKKGVALLY